MPHITFKKRHKLRHLKKGPPLALKSGVQKSMDPQKNQPRGLYNSQHGPAFLILLRENVA